MVYDRLIIEVIVIFEAWMFTVVVHIAENTLYIYLPIAEINSRSMARLGFDPISGEFSLLKSQHPVIVIITYFR